MNLDNPSFASFPLFLLHLNLLYLSVFLQLAASCRSLTFAFFFPADCATFATTTSLSLASAPPLDLTL